MFPKLGFCLLDEVVESVQQIDLVWGIGVSSSEKVVGHPLLVALRHVVDPHFKAACR